jgi:translation initiation factor 2B subunit (eIF-2B alpha/beta/delta family)
VDEAAQRSWHVHPFGWALLADEEKIQLDWEHDSWEWIRPEAILSGELKDDCVPRIDQSFRRVYFGAGGMFTANSLVRSDTEAGKLFMQSLQELRNDNKNGARVLATTAANYLAQIIESMEVLEWDAIRIVAHHLIESARPSMNAAISSAVLTGIQRIQPLVDSNDPTSSIANSLKAFIAERQASNDRVGAHFKRFIESHANAGVIDILTLSSSSTIRSSILHLLTATNLSINLSILESRPLCEGVSMGLSILESIEDTDASKRLKLTLAPDSHIARLAQNLRQPAFLLLGADRISPSGHVSNKTGSLVAAIILKSVSPDSKTVILSESDKIAKPADLDLYESGGQNAQRELLEHSAEHGNVEEVTSIWGKIRGTPNFTARCENLAAVENVYFEWISRDHIDFYICETGAMNRGMVRQISLEKARLGGDIFKNLYPD